MSGVGELSIDERVSAVVKLFTVDESTRVAKAPRATLAPSDPKERGSEALEILKRLRHDTGRFLDVGPLGAGGQSAIRVARQVSLDREVVVKRLPPEKRLPKPIKALLAEAWLTGALEHPNIVPVHDVELDEDGSPVLVMKKIEGKSWGDLIRGADGLEGYEHDGDPLTFHLRVFMQVCNAVHFAHSRGIVHRDLKPDNVMVGYFGEVYVVDWGIATVPKKPKSIAGTPAYLAPEMLAQSEDDMLTFATDVYLLGAILYEILTGAPPHLGEDMEAIVASVLRSPPEMPESAPAELASLATACMQPDPSSRPASAEVVRKAVERFFEHEGSRVLAREAARLEEELDAELAKNGDRQRIYALFTQCRFGFRQSLVTWPNNDDAKDSIRRTTEAMIRYELARRDGPAAAMLLGELPNADASLKDEVAATVTSAAKEARKLRALARSHDPATGNRQRRFFGVTLGVLFSLSPLVGELLGRKTPRELIEGSAFVPIVTLVLLAATWKRMTKSALTRGIMTTIAFAMAVQGIVAMLLIGWGTPDVQSAVALVVLPFYWSFVLGLVSVLFERGVVVGSVMYAGAGIAALRWPSLRFTFIAAANLIIGILAYFLWPTTRDERKATR
jgi:serine/threonine-protein kinase